MSRLIAALAIVLLPLTAAAQPADEPASSAAPAEQVSQGPMKVERIHNQFLAVPEFKWTEFDHQTSGLVGGSAGVVFADAIFIGGAGYGMVTNTNGRELAYGGFVMQWFGRASQVVGYSAKMLIGGGQAESTEGVPVVIDPRGHTATQLVRVHQDFFVFEPEVNGSVRFNRHLSLTGGVGYRFTGHYYGYGYYGGSPYPGHISPDGWTGTIGLQIGSGS